MMPATRATPSASPLARLAPPTRATVPADMRTRHSATASRWVTGLAPTSTMRASPCSSKCVRRRPAICVKDMAVLRAVLFDYGLTLVTFEYPRDELKRVMEEVRLWLPPPAPDAETLMRDVVLPLEDALDDMGEDEVDYLAVYELQWRRAGFPLRRALLERILDREQRVWDDAATPAPDAISTLRALRERGVKTGLVSNAPFPPGLLHRQLAQIGLAPLLDVALFSSEVGKRKPS